MVSCICITHKRTDYLKKSIEYFNNQTYPEKQLIVLFEKDISTKEYIESNLNQYNFLMIYEQVEEKHDELIIQPINDKIKVLDQIMEGESCYIRSSKEGKYITLDNDIIKYINEPSETDVFKLYRNNSSFLLKSKDDIFFAQAIDGKLEVQALYTDTIQWEIVVLANNTFKLVGTENFPNKSYLNHIGWELEMVNDIKSSITFCELQSRHPISLGAKRNLTIHIAAGQYICVWDDDDIYHANRIENQMRFLEFSQRDACSLNTEIFIDNSNGDFYISPPRSEGWENSLICKKSAMGYYDDLPRKEDTPVLYRLWEERKLCVMDDPSLYLYNIHSNNISGSSHFTNLFKWSDKLSNEEVEKIKFNYDL